MLMLILSNANAKRIKTDEFLWVNVLNIRRVKPVPRAAAAYGRQLKILVKMYKKWSLKGLS